MSTLPSQISALSVAEKFDLLDAIWHYIEAHAPPLDEEQKAELDRRVAKYAQNPSSVIPWEQSKRTFLSSEPTGCMAA